MDTEADTLFKLITPKLPAASKVKKLAFGSGLRFTVPGQNFVHLNSTVEVDIIRDSS